MSLKLTVKEREDVQGLAAEGGFNPGKYTVVVEEAKIADIFTTALSTDQALTGTLKHAQMLGAVAAGAALQNNKLVGSFNFVNAWTK